MKSEKFGIKISGKAWREAIECSDVPEQESWPTPMRFNVGGGCYYSYFVTMQEAILIHSHLEDVGTSLTLDGDPQNRADGRAVQRAAAVVARRIAMESEKRSGCRIT